MSQYRDRPFAQRFAQMGDLAEDVYFAVKPLGNTTRFGFRRPEGVKFSDIPELFRHMPDAITPTHLVEVVGLGRDGILKSIKVAKYEALKHWQALAVKGGLLGLVIFVWNSSVKQYIVLSWGDLVKEVAYAKKTDGVQSFKNDGNEYYPLRWERLVHRATLVGVHDAE